MGLLGLSTPMNLDTVTVIRTRFNLLVNLDVNLIREFEKYEWEKLLNHSF